MRLGNTAKEFFDEYWQRYSNDRQRFSNSLKSFAERSEDWINRTIYQFYKWLFVVPLLITTTLLCGIFAIIVALLFALFRQFSH